MDSRELIKASPRLLRATLDSLQAEGYRHDRVTELVVTLTVEGAPLRDVAQYLTLVDRFYGRQHPRGLRSYAQRPASQLEIRATRTGSLEAILAEGAQVVDRHYILLTWILLRGIPHAGRILSECLRNVADAYQNVESGRLTRVQRQAVQRRSRGSVDARRAVRAGMRAFLERDPRFLGMPADRRAELARVLADAYIADEQQVRSIHRFAEERVVEIALRIGGRDL